MREKKFEMMFLYLTFYFYYRKTFGMTKTNKNFIHFQNGNSQKKEFLVMRGWQFVLSYRVQIDTIMTRHDTIIHQPKHNTINKRVKNLNANTIRLINV